MSTRGRFTGVVVLTIGLTSILSLIAGCPIPDGSTPVANDNANDNAGTVDNANDNASTTPKAYVGAAVCLPCHADKHANWTATAHADALEALRGIGQEANAGCIGCHTVAFGETDGYVDEATTPDLAGVQCENCHGPAGAHSRDPGDLASRPVVDLAATVCGACHTDAHHPTMDEWELSAHATALEGLRSSSHAGDGCLGCHSQDYRYAIELQEAGDEVDVPTVETAQLSLECATCHASHGGVDQAHQLRLPIVDLCGQCHTQGEDAFPGGSPHHPQLEMATGVGAFDADNAALTVAFSPHASLFDASGQACAQCHVAAHEVEEPNEGAPNVTGHTFNPFDESIEEHQAEQYTGCIDCHTDADTADSKRTSVQAEIQAELDRLGAYFDSENALYIDPTTLSEADQARLATAKFNRDFVSADGSTGVHNALYARAALAITSDIVAELAP